MIAEKSLVVYKNRPAVVTARGEKITIVMLDREAEYRVREKDITALHPGPVTDFSGFVSGAPAADAAVREAWELLSAVPGEKTGLKELAGLVYGDFTPKSAWDAMRLLLDGLFFRGSPAR